MAADSVAGTAASSTRHWPVLSLASVSAHNTSTDCCVVVHGRVLDVTSFLKEHPGGAAALSKPGRAGCDVTEHFDRIGHSSVAWKKLLTMQIGTLGEEPHPSSSVGPADKETYAVEWHAARRRAILKAHPEVAALQGHNHLTPLIGVGVGLLHAVTCVLAQRCGSLGILGGLGLTLALAATVGAWCKMVQFAVAHDLCHGTAGAWCRGTLAKHMCFHACTLPSVGGETHQYYTLQHLGHHAALGDLSLLTSELQSQTRKAPAAVAVADAQQASDAPMPPAVEEEAPPPPQSAPASPRDGEHAGQRLLPPPAPKEASAEPEAAATFSAHDLMMINLEFDGDLPSPAAVLLMVLNSDETRGQLPPNVEWVHSYANHWATKLLWQPVYQLGHYTLLVVIHLSLAVPINPLTYPLAAAYLAAPPATQRRGALLGARTLARVMGWLLPSMSKSELYQATYGGAALERSAATYAAALSQPAVHSVAVAGLSMGAHTWLWLGLSYALLAHGVPRPSAWTCALGLLYLYLSELFLHGFACHPYFGYFLGVHRSGGDGFAPPSDGAEQPMPAARTSASTADADAATAVGGGCQPTMSTYSRLTSLSCLNLNFHVEHHDFPQVPWSRLPAIKAAAPEFYATLEQSPGFVYTVRQWLLRGDGWDYGCAPPGKARETFLGKAKP